MDGPAAAPDRSPRGGTVRYKSVVARYLPAALLAVSVMAVQPSASPATAAVISNSGDARRNGWYPDQTSLTPALVSSGTFGQLFSTPIVGQVYAQPLVVNDLVFVATEANWIYGIDAVNGAVRWSRNVGTPWNPQDVACGDLVPEVGITGTPAIDDQTGTAYFVAKTYTVGPGTAVRWRMHAVDVTTGIERAGFPVTIQGVADNNPAQPFTPVTQHQRPGLLLMDGVVYAAFGGHCDAPPFRGWVVGVSTAGQIRAMFSTRAGDAAASGNGIWHSEMNASGGEPVHFVQMWVLPDEFGLDPGYDQADVGVELAAGGLIPIASGDPATDSAIRIANRSATLWVARLSRGRRVSLPRGRFTHLFVTEGVIGVGEESVGVGDAIRGIDMGGVEIVGTSDGAAEALVWVMDKTVGE